MMQHLDLQLVINMLKQTLVNCSESTNVNAFLLNCWNECHVYKYLDMQRV